MIFELLEEANIDRETQRNQHDENYSLDEHICVYLYTHLSFFAMSTIWTYVTTTIGRGTDKKVIELNPSVTLEYLKFHLLDIMHDTGASIVDVISLQALAALYATWLANVNPRAEPYRDIIYHLLMDNTKDIIGSRLTDIAQRIIRGLPNVTDDTPARKTVLIDSCPQNAYFCDDKKHFAIATWSTLYDRGSYAQTCGQYQRLQYVRADKIPVVPNVRPRTNFIAPISEDTSQFTDFSIATCTNLRKPLEQQVYDHVIIGTINIPSSGPQVPAIPLRIVLAYRGTSISLVETRENPQSPPVTNPICKFHTRVSRNLVVARSCAQSAKTTRAIVSAWIAYCQDNAQFFPTSAPPELPLLVAGRVRDAALRAYTELSAKHWGDLGLVLDALGVPSRYVATDDHFMAAICSIFGAKFIFKQHQYNPIVTGVTQTYQRNTASIFDTI